MNISTILIIVLVVDIFIEIVLAARVMNKDVMNMGKTVGPLSGVVNGLCFLLEKLPGSGWR